MQINPVLPQKCMYGHSRRALSLGRDALRDLVGNL
jgi:hypothetical protein